jgi:hypothetical protein
VAKKVAKAKTKTSLSPSPSVKDAIITIRGVPVILAGDLAGFFETTAREINQYRFRNEEKFSDYAFQLTKSEWGSLKSQNVTSKTDHGGTRIPPWVYTEHGVAMMSMGMKSGAAVELSKVIIDTFVHYRRGTLPAKRMMPGKEAERARRSLQETIYEKILSILDSELPGADGHTLRDEMGSIANKALESIKAVIDRPAATNEKIYAEVTKIMAEAEKIYAEKRKLDAETDKILLENFGTRLELMRDLQTMAMQLDRDNWLEAFDGFSSSDPIPQLEDKS